MEFLDGFKTVDPKAYLAERVKRGADFVRTIRALNTCVDLKTSNHIRHPEATIPTPPELPSDPPLVTSGQ